MHYFNMLNGSSYTKLVKDFWVRSEVIDEEAAKREEDQKVAEDKKLKGKSRAEMGLLDLQNLRLGLLWWGSGSQSQSPLLLRWLVPEAKECSWWVLITKVTGIPKFTKHCMNEESLTRPVTWRMNTWFFIRWFWCASYQGNEEPTICLGITSIFSTFWSTNFLSNSLHTYSTTFAPPSKKE